MVSKISALNPFFICVAFTTLILLFMVHSVVFAEFQEFPIFESPNKMSTSKEQDRFNEADHTAQIVRQFQDRIRENEDEIRFLINEKDWLQNRIYHLQDLEQPVPWEMHNSMRIKERKINAAFKENSRLNELLAQERYKISTHSASIGRGYDSPSHYSGSSCSQAFKEKLSNEIKAAGLDDWLHFTGDVRDFCKSENCCALENVLPILYASGSARLAGEYKLFLKKLAGVIKNYDIRIRIDGFADVDNINTKQYPSNFELGANRASNIVHELVKNGVKPSLFRIATTGKYRPDGKPMSDKKSLERRSEIFIVFV
ncbi:MAG: OmpA family protein [Desulfamplus sp.]|nr:OmpA family protein [Desulfamplus sp.]